MKELKYLGQRFMIGALAAEVSRLSKGASPEARAVRQMCADIRALARVGDPLAYIYGESDSGSAVGEAASRAMSERRKLAESSHALAPAACGLLACLLGEKASGLRKAWELAVAAETAPGERRCFAEYRLEARIEARLLKAI